MNPAKILVVAGDPALRAAHAGILRQAGHAPLEAASGQEGLRLVDEAAPALVLLGAELPDLPGIEVCRRLRAAETGDAGRPSVLMLSGPSAPAEEQAESLEAGADGCLRLPVEPRPLLAHVGALLRIRSAEERFRAGQEVQRKTVEELKEANRRLEEYNRLKAEFLANMSHELRTPLTAIIGFAQLIEMTERGNLPDAWSRALEKILRNGRHLLALIDDVLDIAKIEAGRMKVHREHFDMAELVGDAFAELQSLATKKRLDYRLRVGAELPLAFTDPRRVRQVLVNLLSNALKFTHRGSIEVELLPWAEKHCRIVVRDTGVGIEAQSMGIIFERFRQVDGSMSRMAGGAGLGLSIVRQIVELLGGTIAVDSRPGEGSTFVVTLPLVAAPPEEMPAPPVEVEPMAFLERLGEEIGPEADGRPRILIIEDDPDAAALLSETLAGAGYRPHVASSGAAGLKAARELRPAAITLDVMMPGMDGWRVLQALKAERQTAEIPVVVCSIVDNRPLGYRLGASAYLVKPVEPQHLTATLDDISTARPPEDGYVLVVDDEHGVREILKTALNKSGYEVRTAATGETALRMIGSSLPRAVLSDLLIPGGMSGYELIARLRSAPETEHIPVLVVTGKDMTAEDRQFILGQIQDVIRKGDLLMSDLAHRLRETLEGIGVTPSHGQDLAG